MGEWLPVVLWCLGALSGVLVCAVTVVRSRYRPRRRRGDGHDAGATVLPVSWSVVGAHLLSLASFVLSFFLLLLGDGQIGRTLAAWYDAALPYAATGACALLAAQLVLMYAQARRAARSQIDRTLVRARRG